MNDMWFDILLKSEGNQMGQWIVYNPNNNFMEAFESLKGKAKFISGEVKNWIPVKTNAVHNQLQQSITTKLLTNALKSKTKLSEEMESRLLKLPVNDFTKITHNKGIGFVVTFNSDDWKSNVGENWTSIAMQQGNGFVNVIYMCPIPYEYFHWNEDMDNKQVYVQKKNSWVEAGQYIGAQLKFPMADKLRGYVLHGNKENKLLAWDKKTGKRTVPRKYENLDSPSTAHIGPREVGIAIQEIIDKGI